MSLLPKIAVIDDEIYHLKLWERSLGNACELFKYECLNEFVEKNINDFNKFEYIIVDIFFGNINALEANFSKLLRGKGYNGKLILNSNLNQSFTELEREHFYDLFLLKNKRYSLQMINERLLKDPLNWKKRFNHPI